MSGKYKSAADVAGAIGPRCGVEATHTPCLLQAWGRSNGLLPQTETIHHSPGKTRTKTPVYLFWVRTSNKGIMSFKWLDSFIANNVDLPRCPAKQKNSPEQIVAVQEQKEIGILVLPQICTHQLVFISRVLHARLVYRRVRESRGHDFRTNHASRLSTRARGLKLYCRLKSSCGTRVQTTVLGRPQLEQALGGTSDSYQISSCFLYPEEAIWPPRSISFYT